MEMVRNSSTGFFIMLFVLLVAYSLVTANVISTTLPAAYAKKGGSKSSGGSSKSSGGSSDGGGSSKSDGGYL
jgi:uncharacterized membrane protein YgcG